MPLKRKWQGHLCPYQSFFIDYEYNVTYTKLTERFVFSNIALGALRKILIYYVKVS